MAEICPATGVGRILISTDGSEFSEGAVREGIRLAKKCSSALSILSVVETNPEFDAVAPQIIEKREKDAREHLNAVKARARSEGVDCATVVRRGEDSYKEIVDEAIRNKNTMIIMGRRGRTGLKRLMIGSVTARVIGEAPCNVLVIPKAAQLEFRNLVAATDGSKYSKVAASEAISLAKRNASLLTVVSVAASELTATTHDELTVNQREFISEKDLQNAEANAGAVKEAAQKEGITVKAVVFGGRPPEAIIETAREKNADLIVLGSHGRTGVEKLLMGSVAERVIVLAPCAVLVVKR